MKEWTYQDSRTDREMDEGMDITDGDWTDRQMNEGMDIPVRFQDGYTDGCKN